MAEKKQAYLDDLVTEMFEGMIEGTKGNSKIVFRLADVNDGNPLSKAEYMDALKSKGENITVRQASHLRLQFSGLNTEDVNFKSDFYDFMKEEFPFQQDYSAGQESPSPKQLVGSLRSLKKRLSKGGANVTINSPIRLIGQGDNPNTVIKGIQGPVAKNATNATKYLNGIVHTLLEGGSRGILNVGEEGIRDYRVLAVERKIHKQPSRTVGKAYKAFPTLQDDPEQLKAVLKELNEIVADIPDDTTRAAAQLNLTVPMRGENEVVDIAVYNKEFWNDPDQYQPLLDAEGIKNERNLKGIDLFTDEYLKKTRAVVPPYVDLDHPHLIQVPGEEDVIKRGKKAFETQKLDDFTRIIVRDQALQAGNGLDADAKFRLFPNLRQADLTKALNNVGYKDRMSQFKHLLGRDVLGAKEFRKVAPTLIFRSGGYSGEDVAKILSHSATTAGELDKVAARSYVGKAATKENLGYKFVSELYAWATDSQDMNDLATRQNVAKSLHDSEFRIEHNLPGEAPKIVIDLDVTDVNKSVPVNVNDASRPRANLSQYKETKKEQKARVAASVKKHTALGQEWELKGEEFGLRRAKVKEERLTTQLKNLGIEKKITAQETANLAESDKLDAAKKVQEEKVLAKKQGHVTKRIETFPEHMRIQPGDSPDEIRRKLAEQRALNTKGGGGIASGLAIFDPEVSGLDLNEIKKVGEQISDSVARTGKVIVGGVALAWDKLPYPVKKAIPVIGAGFGAWIVYQRALEDKAKYPEGEWPPERAAKYIAQGAEEIFSFLPLTTTDIEEINEWLQTEEGQQMTAATRKRETEQMGDRASPYDDWMSLGQQHPILQDEPEYQQLLDIEDPQGLTAPKPVDQEMSQLMQPEPSAAGLMRTEPEEPSPVSPEVKAPLRNIQPPVTPRSDKLEGGSFIPEPEGEDMPPPKPSLIDEFLPFLPQRA